MDRIDPRKSLGLTQFELVDADTIYSGDFGSITPVAAQYSMAGLRPNLTTAAPSIIILGIFLRPSSAMDIKLCSTTTDYSGVNTIAQPHYLGSSTAPSVMYSNSNAAPSVTVMRTYPNVSTAGIFVSDFNLNLVGGGDFVAVGGTVNVGLAGWLCFYQGPRIRRPT